MADFCGRFNLDRKHFYNGRHVQPGAINATGAAFDECNDDVLYSGSINDPTLMELTLKYLTDVRHSQAEFEKKIKQISK